MFKKSVLSLTLLVLAFNFASISCDTPVDTCGPFPQYFETMSFISDIARISITSDSGLSIRVFELNPERISSAQFSIRLTPVVEFYSDNMNRAQKQFFNNAAFACSPPIPESQEVITDLRINSNLPFNAYLDTEADLASFFDVITFSQNSGYNRYSITEFLLVSPTVPSELFLVLNTPPETEQPLQFTIQYSQDGRSMDAFEFTTNPVLITE